MTAERISATPSLRGYPEGMTPSDEAGARTALQHVEAEFAPHRMGWARPPILTMPKRNDLALSNLTNAFLAGEWIEDSLVERGGRACGGRSRWMRPLVRRILAEFRNQVRPSYPTLLRFLRSDPGYREHCPARTEQSLWPIERMMPATGPPQTWRLPSIINLAQLAEWLRVTHGELDWFADLSRRNRKSKPHLWHYGHRWLSGRNGKLRLLEIPRARLKTIQRKILDEILSHIPPHDSAHAYRRNRSIVTFATPHVGQPIVLAMDLRAFFPTVTAPMVRAIFRTVGYPDAVARCLAGLCTSDVPEKVLRASPNIGQTDWYHTAARLREPHLPQGVPTSPALGNLAGFRLDCRLVGLARVVGANYTRYADDIAFSGDDGFRRCLGPF